MGLFKGLKQIIGGAAPLLGTVIAGPFGAQAGAMIAGALGVENTPQAIEQELINNPAAMAKVKAIEAEKRGELKILYQQTILTEVQEFHQTSRAMIMSDDPFVKRQRPFFGYVIAVCFGLQFLMFLFIGIWTVVMNPGNTGPTFAGLAAIASALAPIWGVALTVQGFNITSRSRDKQVAAGGQPAPGILGAIVNNLTGGNKNG